MAAEHIEQAVAAAEIIIQIPEGVQGVQAYSNLGKDLAGLNVMRGGEKGFYGYVNEPLAASYIQAETGYTARFIDNNSIADVKIQMPDGTVQLAQAKIGYDKIGPAKLQEWVNKYKGQTFLISEDQPELAAKLESLGAKVQLVDVSKDETRIMAAHMQREGKIWVALGGENKAPVTSRIIQLQKQFSKTAEVSATATQSAAALTAGFSIGKNLYDLIEGDTDLIDMATAVAKDTLIAGVSSYAGTFVSTLAISAVGGTSVGAAVGSALAPVLAQLGPITAMMPAGALPMFLLGLAAGTAYTTCMVIVTYSKRTKERREITKKIIDTAKEAGKILDQYYVYLEKLGETQRRQQQDAFNQGISMLDSGDVDGMIDGLDTILKQFNARALNLSRADIDAAWRGEATIKI